MNDNEISIFPRVSRRDFLKFCGMIGVLIGAGKMAAPDIALALEKLAKRPSVVWSSFMICTGCAISFLQNRTPSVANLILQNISLDYQDNLMAPSGEGAEKSFNDAVDTRDFYYVVEGAIPTKVREALTIGGVWAGDIAKEAYEKAKGVISIGSCSSDGNIQAAAPNPTGAMGLKEFLQREGVYDENKPVINLPRCPGNGDDLIPTLAFLLYYNRLPELDSLNRPVFLYGQTLHDNCERRGHFEAGEFVEVFGDEASQERWCLYKVGCKGPQTFAPCSTMRWNGHLSWCVHNGPCIGCAEPNFWDNLTPFNQPVADIKPPVAGVSPTTIGVALGVATAVGIGAHFVAQAAAGRLGHGGPPEEEKAGPKRFTPRGGES